MLTVEEFLITISLDPFSLYFAAVQGTLASLTFGSPSLNGGPFQIENPSGSRTEEGIKKKINMPLNKLYVCVYACKRVCACVCVRERERST